MAAALPARGCVFHRRAYNAASGRADECADTKACSPARGLCSPGRQTEREPVPYPVVVLWWLELQSVLRFSSPQYASASFQVLCGSAWQLDEVATLLLATQEVISVGIFSVVCAERCGTGFREVQRHAQSRHYPYPCPPESWLLCRCNPEQLP